MKFKLGLCQMPVVKEKDINLKKAEEMIREAASRGAQMISLPEIFNSPYSSKHFRGYAEDEKGKTVTLLSSLAKELSVYLIGGTIPEIQKEPNEAIYNTSFAFDPEGKIIGRYRKIHLFDVDVQGGIRMKESDTLTAGDEMMVFDTEFGKIGIAICYDVRFPELIRNIALAGAELIIIPAAFSYATGVAHWDVTMRARAIDNQVYIAAVSPVRDESGHYKAFGHSCIVTPWGEFCAKTDFRESIVYADIDFDYTKSVREQLPLLQHRRPDIYEKINSQNNWRK